MTGETMSVEKKNGERCCSLQKRRMYVGKRSRKGDRMKSFCHLLYLLCRCNQLQRDTSIRRLCGCRCAVMWIRVGVNCRDLVSVVTHSELQMRLLCQWRGYLRASISGPDLDIHFIARTYIHRKIWNILRFVAELLRRFRLYRFLCQFFPALKFISLRIFCKS